MAGRAHRVYFAAFLVVLAPIGAVVLIAALLLFGMQPQLVFAPGRGVKALLEAGGFHVANRVAVAGTAIFWWAVFALLGLAWELRSRGRLVD